MALGPETVEAAATQPLSQSAIEVAGNRAGRDTSHATLHDYLDVAPAPGVEPGGRPKRYQTTGGARYEYPWFRATATQLP
jgi:hypothetical protein